MAEKSNGLEQTLSRLDAVMIVVGNVVGVGIFTTTGFIAADLPDARMIMGVWLFGGLLTLLGALTYGELGAAFPHAGGDYVYLREAYGPLAGFLVGWMGFFIINPGSIAALSLGLAEYLLPLAVRDVAGLSPVIPKLIAVSAILLFTWINVLSVRWASRAQNLVGGLNLMAIVLVLGLGFVLGSGSWEHFNFHSQSVSVGDLFGPAMISVFFTYSGWFVSAYVASEIKEPQKTLPQSLIISSVIVTFLYAMVNVFYIYALPIPEMKSVVDIARRASEATLGSEISVLISLTIILAILGSLNSVILTAPRIYFAMAGDGLFPSAFGKVHPRYRTPHLSIVIQTALSCVMVLVGSFYQLLSYAVFFMLVSSVATAVGVFVIRQRKSPPDLPYKVWGYPFTPLVFAVSYAWIACRIFLRDPVNAVIGICITLSGIPFFITWRKRKERNR